MTKSIVAYLGISFIILAFFNLLGLVNLSSLTLASFSLAALFILIQEVMIFYYEKNNKQLPQTQEIYVYLAMVSIVVFPNLNIEIPQSYAAKANDLFSMLVFGMTFVFISLKDYLKK